MSWQTAAEAGPAAVIIRGTQSLQARRSRNKVTLQKSVRKFQGNPASSTIVSMSKSSSRKPIEIKISTVVAVSAILREVDLGVLDAAMQEMTGGNVDFFEDEFTVIDIGALAATHPPIDWHAITTLLKAYRLNAVAVRNAAPEMEADILAHGLSLDGPLKAPAPAADAKASVPVQAEIELEAAEVALEIAPVMQQTAHAAAPAQFAANTMIVDMPVRAGQRIYARGADLIITAAVNSGAEVIADGSIHIYAPLRGRALAGASGNTEARIFTLSMEAELVSIAGMYRTFEDGFPADRKQQATQVRLIGNRIDMLPIKAAA
ncbi:putative Septum formation inhibitor MinC [Herminiimonas arsenicoxydans]|uniref:Probable septum site-determining protein MinC n=1 Tax=Herminiimonas arsenicoxydans TaxID=204773 RepID=A4G415_HERAR|nr:putative Septum formation inhibitor MinC [Herminiimonas arsenicoxydans]